MKSADLFVQALENEGIEYIFGVPGEENLDLLESLRKSKTIKLIVTRHEQSAGFMAATVGRLTGMAGVCLATLGPGATNLTTAAAYAGLGGFPMMMITGQKPILKSKQGMFQIVDIVGMMRPMCKLTKTIVDGGLVSSLVREAVRRAVEERPGAVHLELPEDVSREKVPEDGCMLFPIDRVRRPIAEDKAIRSAVEMINEAQHPLLVIGAGANRKFPSKMLRQFVKQTGIPFCDTQMGKGVVDSRTASYMGTAAISSDDYVHAAIHHADLIIMVGHDVVEKPPFIMSPKDNRKVIHINYFTAQVDQVYWPHLEVVGDIGNAIWQLNQSLPSKPQRWDLRYFQYVCECLHADMSIGCSGGSFPLSPPCLVHIVRQAVEEDGILCLDNGLYKVWFARQYPAYQPNTLLLDNALAAMGAGLPSAIAAKITAPNKQVVAVCGDGGFMMNSQELATAVSLKLHLTVLLLNDEAYGMIKWKQTEMGFDEYGVDLANPDFIKYAEAYGAKGYKVSAYEELGKLLQHCLTTHGVHVIEVPIDYAMSSRLQVEALREHLSQAMKTAKDFFASLPPEPSPEAAVPNGGAQAPPAEEEEIEGGARHYPFYLAGKPETPNSDLAVTDKYSGKVAYRVAKANKEIIEKGIKAAVAVAPVMSRMPTYQKRAVLAHCVDAFTQRFEELAQSLCVEAGKPIKDARGEVQRLIDTFTIAMEECSRVYGEFAPMDIGPRTEGMQAITRMFPLGPISMVSPFNFPLNLAAHKVAPALAVGCPFVLKPASKTPIGALIIGEVLAAAPYLPPGAFSVLPCDRTGADLFTTDDRFKLLSFTGSPDVGWAMKARAGRKKVVLELGGNAACVMDDYAPGEVDSVVSKIIHGAYYQSGQSCIGVQRLYVRQDHYDDFVGKLTAAVKALKSGDPHNEDVMIGPMISEKEAARVEEWINEAVDRGGQVLAGGTRYGVIVEATLLSGVPRGCKVYEEEVFGPVLVVEPFTTFLKVVETVNDSRFGLQAGIFTRDLDKAWYAYEHMDVGGVVVNQVPSIRVDSQAYGGVKDSGLGREGIRWAMRDMMEERVLLMSGIGKLKDGK